MITPNLQLPEPVAAGFVAAADQLNARSFGCSPRDSHRSVPPCRRIIVTERKVLPQNECYRREQLPEE